MESPWNTNEKGTLSEEMNEVRKNINIINQQIIDGIRDNEEKLAYINYWNVMSLFVNNIKYTPENLTLLIKVYSDMIGLAKNKNITITSISGGRRRNNSTNTDMKMKDVKILCKKNQIKLSTTVNDKRVVYTKKDLITKLKRKKAL